MPMVSLASIDYSLNYGSKGPEVTELQEFLIDQGYLTGVATGNFYSLTLKAVKAYQGEQNLPKTGYVGVLTRAAINASLVLSLNDSKQEEVAENVPTPTPTPDAILAELKRQNDLIQQQIAAQHITNQLLTPTPTPTPIPSPTPIPLPADTTPPVVSTFYDSNGSGRSITVSVNEPSKIQVYFMSGNTPLTENLTIGQCEQQPYLYNCLPVDLGPSGTLSKVSLTNQLVTYNSDSLTTTLSLDTTKILQDKNLYYFAVKATDASGNVSLPMSSDRNTWTGSEYFSNTDLYYWSVGQHITTSF